VGVHR